MADPSVEPTRGRTYDAAGTLVAGGFIALGIVLILETRSMTPLGSVFPIAISSAMIVFSVLVLVRNVVLGLRGARKAGPEGGSAVRRLLLVAVMASWVALLPVLGFFTASLLGYFAAMAVATYEHLSFRELALLLVIGLGILAGFTLLMADVLLIPLPRGILF